MPERPHRVYWWKEALIVVAFYLALLVDEEPVRLQRRRPGGDAGFEAFHNAERRHPLRALHRAVPRGDAAAAVPAVPAFIQFWNTYYGTAHFVVTLAVFILLFLEAPGGVPGVAQQPGDHDRPGHRRLRPVPADAAAPARRAVRRVRRGLHRERPAAGGRHVRVRRHAGRVRRAVVVRLRRRWPTSPTSTRRCRACTSAGRRGAPWRCGRCCAGAGNGSPCSCTRWRRCSASSSPATTAGSTASAGCWRSPSARSPAGACTAGTRTASTASTVLASGASDLTSPVRVPDGHRESVLQRRRRTRALGWRRALDGIRRAVVAAVDGDDVAGVRTRWPGRRGRRRCRRSRCRSPQRRIGTRGRLRSTKRSQCSAPLGHLALDPAGHARRWRARGGGRARRRCPRIMAISPAFDAAVVLATLLAEVRRARGREHDRAARPSPPSKRSTMCRIASWAVKNAPSRLTRSTRRHSSTRHLEEARRAPADTGVDEARVDAPELADRLGHRRDDGVAVADVAHHGVHVAAELAELARRRRRSSPGSCPRWRPLRRGRPAPRPSPARCRCCRR